VATTEPHAPLFDLVVVGGGINGAGIARDAVGRGLSVCLIERDDLASHTSSTSTKLIHGGLRYLEHGELRLVRESLQERERLLAIAPHIVRPLRFVLPYVDGLRPRWLLRLGLFVYDHVGGREKLAVSQGLDLAGTVEGEPALAKNEFGAVEIDGGPWCKFTNPNTGREVIVKDVIADAFLQQILLRPAEYDVIATLNLNGDYVSDALAAQVGGIGIAPGANISDEYAVFEATHGTAPKYAGLDKVTPGSLILSAEMMLRHLGWREAADMVIDAMEAAIASKNVTYDFARLMDGATEVSCSAFGDEMIARM
jgi:hypothetical protein